MKQDEHERMFAFINEFWIYIKDFWEIADTDEWWTAFMSRADAIADSFKDDKDVFEIAKRLIITFMKYQDERARERRKGSRP